MGLDWEAFRRYQLVRRGHETATEYETRRKIRQAIKEGLQLDRVAAGQAQALDELERFLAEFRTRHSLIAYNQQVRVLNRLAGFYGYDNIRLRKLKESKAATKALQAGQIRALARYTHPTPDIHRLHRVLIMLGLTAGLRLGELHRANASDVDLENCRLHIRRPSKKGMVRWIPLPSWAASPKRPLVAYLKHREPPRGDPDALIVTHRTRQGQRRGAEPRRLGPEYIARVFNDISQRVGFRVNATILRHTLGHELARLGYATEAIQLILGHARITSTVVYTEMQPHDVEFLFKRRPRADIYQGKKSKEVGTRENQYLRDPYAEKGF